MDVLLALLIVLLFGALPMQPYTVSGRGRCPSHANEPKPRTMPVNGDFEAEVDAIEWELQSQFSAKWEAAEAIQ
jgi:hypothetical protein